MLKSRKQHKKNLLQNSLRILTKYCRCWCWTDWENTLEHSEEWKELLQEEIVTWGGRDLLVFCFVFVFFSLFYSSCRSEEFESNHLWKHWFIAEEQWTDNDWVSDLRVSHVTFQKLCEERAPFIEKIDRKVTKSWKVLFIVVTLW